MVSSHPGILSRSESLTLFVPTNEKDEVYVTELGAIHVRMPTRVIGHAGY